MVAVKRGDSRRRTLFVEALEERSLLSVGTVYEPTLHHVHKLDAMLSPPSLESPQTIALDYLRSHAADFGLTSEDLSHFRVTDRYTSANNGVTHLYLQQTFNDLPVASSVINANLMPDGRIINIGSSFVSGLEATPVPTARIPATAKIAADVAFASLVDSIGLHTDGRSEPHFEAALHYVPVASGEVRLAWQIDVQHSIHQVWINASVDARTGEVLRVINQEQHADASYSVFPLPKESPLDGYHQQIDTPADLVASPFGWHDTNGIAGAEFTDTRGNNAIVQDDLDSNNTGGSRPDAGSDLVFDFDFDPHGTLSSNLDAAIVNAFYMTNVLHDIHYQYGFDEVAGNFQTNNYGRGGAGNDAVIVDVQDGGGRSNALFLVAADGSPGRMELFVWDPTASVFINSPALESEQVQSTEAAFGPSLPSVGITADLVMADPADACSALINTTELVGMIVLIDRGTCFFDEKVKHAQDAGAVAVIVANNVPTGLVNMSGDDPTITIPSVFVTQDSGNLLKSTLSSSLVNITIAGAATDFDGAFDNGVIVHEYGHGVSQRLTAGPSNVSALTGVQSGAMGEGWSDWWALMFTQTDADRANDAFPFATYLTNGIGLRSHPYSFDLSVNPLTYADLPDRANSVHASGEIWTSALWDLNWLLIDGDGALIAPKGFDDDLYHGQGGNNLALQLIMDGLKLQPANPTMLDARDAILLADQINNDGENQLAIWTAFARRGMGIDAVDGGSTNSTNVTAGFTIPELQIPLDFGDAPTASLSGLPNSYPTNLTDDGARHVIGELFLGDRVDADPDGQSAMDAGASGTTGDDGHASDDEDGVLAISSLVANGTSASMASVHVTASQAGKLDAWIDFNRDGDWSDANEQIFASLEVTAGENRVGFTVPTMATPGFTFARFRLSSMGGLSPTGAASDGEVEDYQVLILDGDAAGGIEALFQFPSSSNMRFDTDGNDITVLDATTELFRASMNSLKKLHVIGSADDDTLILADLSLIHSGLLSVDAGQGEDTFQIVGDEQSLDLTLIAVDAIQNIRTIDIRGDGDNHLTFDASDIDALAAPGSSLIVLMDPTDTLSSGVDQFSFTGSEAASAQLQVIAQTSDGTTIRVRGSRWTNPFEPLDVNGSGLISPVDALVILNELSRRRYVFDGTNTLQDPASVPEFPLVFLDPAGNGTIVPLHALRILNALNRRSLSQQR